MSHAIPFPLELPEGYQWLKDEVAFDPARHLALEFPNSMLKLDDLGYKQEDFVNKATSFAVSAPFRILSKEGAEIMLQTSRRLRIFAKRAGNRIENVVRDGSETFASVLMYVISWHPSTKLIFLPIPCRFILGI